MIAISNSQRDEIIRFLDILADEYSRRTDRSSSTQNLRRRIGILRMQLIKRNEFPSSVLTDIKRNFAKSI